MRKYIIGFVIGFVLGNIVMAYAAQRITLQDGDGNVIGTTANPLYAEAV